MFPDDIRETDNAHHQRIREEVTNFLSSPLQTNIEQLKMAALQSSVFSLSPFKAPNPDDSIYFVMLQQTFDIVKHDLYVIVNNCLQLNYFPDYLKNAYIAIIKKGAKKPDDEVKSYRPISLLPVIGKCIEKIIHKHLVNIAVSNEWISSKQFGFQEGKSCEMAVPKLVGRTESAFKSKQYALVIFLDISAAFDSAWHDAILHNLIKLNCPAAYIHFIASFLCNRQATISINGELITKQLNRSCPQGGILPPFLWLILINDLLTITLPISADIQCFADDAALSIVSNSLKEIETIANSLLDVIHKWGLSVKLSFNPIKCEAVIFTGKINMIPITLTMNNQNIKIVHEAKYLGVWLDRRLNWQRHTSTK